MNLWSAHILLLDCSLEGFWIDLDSKQAEESSICSDKKPLCTPVWAVGKRYNGGNKQWPTKFVQQCFPDNATHSGLCFQSPSHECPDLTRHLSVINKVHPCVCVARPCVLTGCCRGGVCVKINVEMTWQSPAFSFRQFQCAELESRRGWGFYQAKGSDHQRLLWRKEITGCKHSQYPNSIPPSRISFFLLSLTSTLLSLCLSGFGALYFDVNKQFFLPGLLPDPFNPSIYY